MTGRAVVLRGDAASLPLPDASVDLIVTSPPYFGLRSYTDGGEHYQHQIGSEATPAEYLAALLACTREWIRVLKPEGSLFVNLGDRYATRWSSRSEGAGLHHDRGRDSRGGRNLTGIGEKSLLGLPWRYALAVTDQLALILRAEIIWDKPNGLPESVTDRVRRSHEQVFHLVKQPRYYSAVDEVREAHTGKRGPETYRRTGVNGAAPEATKWANPQGGARENYRFETEHGREYNPLGKLPGSVWSIPSAPLTVPEHLGVDHFAAYPPELVRRIILGWSPPAICTACGQGRRPAVEREASDWMERKANGEPVRHGLFGAAGAKAGGWRGISGVITGYACGCPHPDAPARPAIVLDPFGGTGTTALTAAAYGRTGVTIDRSMDYCRLARWRVHDPAERARAMQVPKPPPVPDGQGSLFDEVAL